MTSIRANLISKIEHNSDCTKQMQDYLSELYKDILDKLLQANDPLLMKRHQGDLNRIKDY